MEYKPKKELFVEGQMVVMVKPYDGLKAVGEVGVIRKILDYTYCIEFFRADTINKNPKYWLIRGREVYNMSLHNLGGVIASQAGWNMPASCFIAYEIEPEGVALFKKELSKARESTEEIVKRVKGGI